MRGGIANKRIAVREGNQDESEAVSPQMSSWGHCNNQIKPEKIRIYIPYRGIQGI